MQINHLALDIETVPVKKLEEYHIRIQEKVLAKINRQQEKNPEFDYNYFASTHGDFGKIICISLGYVTEEKTIRLKSFLGQNEFQILTDFNEVILNYHGIFIHYNGLNFDIPFILQRMAHHGLKPSNQRFTNLRRFTTDPHMDVMMGYYNWDMQKVLPLEILAELYGLPNPKTDLTGDMVYEAYQKEEWKKIQHYCEFDTATVLNLWWKLIQHETPINQKDYLFSI
jgi:predicted PolB exonuclease-like 3'-5' exonuclease